MTLPWRTRLIVAAIVFLIAFGTYVRTLAPTVVLNDSGELALAVWGLGNAHPPGSPVYLLATHPAVWLPFGTIAWRINLASAFFAALAAALMSLAAFELAKKAAIPVALFAGLTLAFSRALWNYATVTEVYALNVALIVGGLFLLLLWRRTRDQKAIAAATLLFGLGLGVHYVITLMAGIAALILVLAARVTRREILVATAALLLALTTYAYLPIRAMADTPFDWGDPSTRANFVDHVSAKQYRGFVDPEHAKIDFPLLLALYRRDLGPWPVIVVLLIAGVVALIKHDRALLAAMAAIVILNVAWMRFYWIVNDRDAYLLPMLIATVLVIARGVALIAEGLGPLGMAAASLALILPFTSAKAAFPDRDRSEYRIAENYALDALEAMQPNALLLIGDWQLRSPLMYYLGAEKRRADVAMIDVGEVSHAWYLDEIARQYPALIKAVQPQHAAFRETVARRERTPPAEWNSNEEYVIRLTNLLEGLAEHQLAQRGHVYATFDIPANIDIAVGPTHQRLAQRYPVIPRRVLVEYATPAIEDPQPPQLRDAGLEPPIEAGDARGHVTRIYRDAWLLYAKRYAMRQQPEVAVTLFDRAARLDTEGEAARMRGLLLRR